MELFDYQKQIVNCTSKNIIAVLPRKSGKTTIAIERVRNRLKQNPELQIAIITLSYNQAKIISEALSEFRERIFVLSCHSSLYKGRSFDEVIVDDAGEIDARFGFNFLFLLKEGFNKSNLVILGTPRKEKKNTPITERSLLEYLWKKGDQFIKFHINNNPLFTKEDLAQFRQYLPPLMYKTEIEGEFVEED